MYLFITHSIPSHLRVLLSLLIIVTLIGMTLSSIPLASAYVNPATGSPQAGTLLRSFDKPSKNWLPGHRGVDLPLEIGSDVKASARGIIAFSGIVFGTPTISIDHPDGVRTTYQPVHSFVSQGDAVDEGEVIGRLGHPTTTFPGLQWGAKIGEDYLNPISLLPKPTIRLLPLDR